MFKGESNFNTSITEEKLYYIFICSQIIDFRYNLYEYLGIKYKYKIN